MNYKFNRYKDISFSHLNLKSNKKKTFFLEKIKKPLGTSFINKNKKSKIQNWNRPNLKLYLYKVNNPIR